VNVFGGWEIFKIKYIVMQDLYSKLQKINEINLETWQKIEMIVNEIFSFTKKRQIIWISNISDVEILKGIYSQEIKETKERLAISNIDNWLKIDESRLQNFRKNLDKREISVRIICKPQWIKYEPNWFKNREIKTLSSKYLLVSNIDIIDWNKIIITTPWEEQVWIYIIDQTISKLLKRLFYDLRNGNQYILWITSGDDTSTQKWIEIMHSWKNFWIDYVINPILYKKIFENLNHWKKKIVDFWCGLNTLGMQLLYWIPSQIEWLKNIKDIESLRKNISEFSWFEANENFVEQALKDSKDIEAEELKIIWKELVKNNKVSKKNESIDICLSRNFIVHLNYEDFDYHLSEAHRILTKWGTYIIATLNPNYEQEKYNKITNNTLIDWDRYNHYHWNSGELWTRVQYYKTKENLEKYMNKYFKIVSCDSCFPTNDKGKNSHPLYYNNNCPMGVVYILKK